MNKIATVSLLSALALSFAFASAQVTDTFTAPANQNCVSLQNNMLYRSRDASTNGEVSALQDFLNPQYLSSEPTGFFGRATEAAVKAFQVANGITGNGLVGPLTRAKIQSLTCGGTSSGNGTTNTTVNTNQTPIITQTAGTSVKQGDTISIYGNYFDSATYLQFSGQGTPTTFRVGNGNVTLSYAGLMYFTPPTTLAPGQYTVQIGKVGGSLNTAANGTVTLNITSGTDATQSGPTLSVVPSSSSINVTYACNDSRVTGVGINRTPQDALGSGAGAYVASRASGFYTEAANPSTTYTYTLQCYTSTGAYYPLSNRVVTVTTPSSSNFGTTTSNPSITLTAPIGGEGYQVGGSALLSWYTQGFSPKNITIYLSAGNIALGNKIIVASLGAYTQLSYFATIPNVPTGTYIVTVCENATDTQLPKYCGSGGTISITSSNTSTTSNQPTMFVGTSPNPTGTSVTLKVGDILYRTISDGCLRGSGQCGYSYSSSYSVSQTPGSSATCGVNLGTFSWNDANVGFASTFRQMPPENAGCTYKLQYQVGDIPGVGKTAVFNTVIVEPANSSPTTGVPSISSVAPNPASPDSPITVTGTNLSNINAVTLYNASGQVLTTIGSTGSDRFPSSGGGTSMQFTISSTLLNGIGASNIKQIRVSTPFGDQSGLAQLTMSGSVTPTGTTPIITGIKTTGTLMTNTQIVILGQNFQYMNSAYLVADGTTTQIPTNGQNWNVSSGGEMTVYLPDVPTNNYKLYIVGNGGTSNGFPISLTSLTKPNPNTLPALKITSATGQVSTDNYGHSTMSFSWAGSNLTDPMGGVLVSLVRADGSSIILNQYSLNLYSLPFTGSYTWVGPNDVNFNPVPSGTYSVQICAKNLGAVICDTKGPFTMTFAQAAPTVATPTMYVGMSPNPTATSLTVRVGDRFYRTWNSNCGNDCSGYTYSSTFSVAQTSGSSATCGVTTGVTQQWNINTASNPTAGGELGNPQPDIVAGCTYTLTYTSTRNGVSKNAVNTVTILPNTTSAISNSIKLAADFINAPFKKVEQMYGTGADAANITSPSSLLGLKNGSDGEAVVALKKILIKYVKTDFCPTLSTSSKFGPSTEVCLRVFQKNNNIKVTGVVDDATFAKLKVYLK